MADQTQEQDPPLYFLLPGAENPTAEPRPAYVLFAHHNLMLLHAIDGAPLPSPPAGRAHVQETLSGRERTKDGRLRYRYKYQTSGPVQTVSPGSDSLDWSNPGSSLSTTIDIRQSLPVPTQVSAPSTPPPDEGGSPGMVLDSDDAPLPARRKRSAPSLAEPERPKIARRTHSPADRPGRPRLRKDKAGREVPKKQ
ncbi:hypothetical protein JX265_009748 [Neoarthrinium moseri]|uniref:Uncharacterized protein n=1 Tax=Neoarthrinium moseri TaxID=1658444 RepID=A0A9P9WFX7_9PEZI|nr:hypothetical protein JX265_009748 [Neoarthrinium moseri]